MASDPSRRTLLRAATVALGSSLPLGTALAAPAVAASRDTDHCHQGAAVGRTISAFGEGDWILGTPGAPGPTVPRDQLRQLPGTFAGPELVVSNNPETVTGPGWLMQHARTTATRGGAAHPLSGVFPLYLYHQNSTGGPAYLHVLVSNPNANAVTVSARGAAWTNADKPLVQDPAQRAGTGPCYATSADWLTGKVPTTLAPTRVAPRTAVEAARLPMTGSILDGRFEITADAGVYTYTVVTTDGDLTKAVNMSQTDSAWAPGNIVSQTDTTYGRQAGVYGASSWTTGATALDVPAAGRYLGLAVNTTERQAAALDQTAPATAALADSSLRSWGNYGAWYDIDLRLRNPSAGARSVRVTFGSNVTAATDVPGDTWNGAMAVSVDGGQETVRTVYVRPTVPRDTLAELALPAGATRSVRLRFLVPGLITAGSQILLESV